MIVRDPLTGIILAVMIVGGFWFGIETRAEVKHLHNTQGLIIDKTSNRFENAEKRINTHFKKNEDKSDFLIEQVRRRINRIEERGEKTEKQFTERLYRLEQLMIDTRLMMFEKRRITPVEIKDE